MMTKKKGKLITEEKEYMLDSPAGLEVFSLPEKHIIATIIAAENPSICYIEKITVEINEGGSSFAGSMYVYKFVEKIAVADGELVVRIGCVDLPGLRNFIFIFSPLRDAVILLPLKSCNWFVNTPIDLLLKMHD